MSDLLTANFFQEPHVVVTLSVVLSVIASLAITFLKKNHLAVAANNRIVKLNRRLEQEKKELENRLDEEIVLRSRSEEKFRTRIADLRRSLRQVTSKSDENVEDIAQIRQDFSASVDAVEFNVAIILTEIKKELLRRVGSIEKIESTLNAIHIFEKWPSLNSSTRPYRLSAIKKELKSTQDIQDITIPADPEGYEHYLETIAHENGRISSLPVQG